jgi:hypothetical protein
LFGLPATAEVTYADFLAGVYPPDLPYTEAAVHQALDPAGLGAYDSEYRTRKQGQNTQLHWAWATGRAFFDEAHTQAQPFTGTIMVITEAKVTQECLQHAYEDLEVKITFRNLEPEREVQQLCAKLAAQGL